VLLSRGRKIEMHQNQGQAGKLTAAFAALVAI